MSRSSRDDHAGEDRRYRAPALEKGLDILELLARESGPFPIMAISQKLGRSKSELFRMIQVLEYRGFIRQAPGGEGFVATDRLFSLGLDQTPTKSMLEIALPRMKELAARTGHGCHLAVRAQGDMVVVARVESAELLGFTVRIGYRRSLAQSCSGAVMFAFQDDDVRERWLASLSGGETEADLAGLLETAATIREQGYARMASPYVDGITVLSAPVLRGHTAAAALTIPFVRSTQLTMPVDEVLRQLRAAAAEISASLLLFDHRV